MRMTWNSWAGEKNEMVPGFSIFLIESIQDAYPSNTLTLLCHQSQTESAELGRASLGSRLGNL